MHWILIGLILGCGKEEVKTGVQEDSAVETIPDSSMPWADLECVPGGEFISISGTATLGTEYAEMCEPHLGVTPEFDCNDGVTIPVQVDGEDIWYDPDFYNCDNYSLQVGQCIPGSTINRFEGRTAEGEAMPEVVWAAFCRSQVAFAEPGSEMAFENHVQMIGYNYETGATCFFNGRVNFARHDGQTQTEEAWKAKGFIPSSTEPSFNDVMGPPILPPCTMCHKSSPFIHNDWIDGAKMPDNPEEPVLPIVNGANAPYWIVGHSDWDMRTIHMDDNACLGCHRANTGMIGLALRHDWDPSLEMPPGNPGGMHDDYAKLVDCYENTPDNTPGCDWVIPPGGGCEGGRVGDDYPYQDSQELPPQ